MAESVHNGRYSRHSATRRPCVISLQQDRSLSLIVGWAACRDHPATESIEASNRPRSA
jgi:hypothetical protein